MIFLAEHLNIVYWEDHDWNWDGLCGGSVKQNLANLLRMSF